MMIKGKLLKEISYKYLENLEHGVILYSNRKGVVFGYQKTLIDGWLYFKICINDLIIPRRKDIICVFTYLKSAKENKCEIYYYNDFLEFMKDIDSWI